MASKDKSTDSVYRVTEVIGTSAQSWEDAAKTAVETVGTLVLGILMISQWPPASPEIIGALIPVLA